jgi:hypothetical protein
MFGKSKREDELSARLKASALDRWADEGGAGSIKLPRDATPITASKESREHEDPSAR